MIFKITIHESKESIDEAFQLISAKTKAVSLVAGQKILRFKAADGSRKFDIMVLGADNIVIQQSGSAPTTHKSFSDTVKRYPELKDVMKVIEKQSKAMLKA